MKCLNLVTDQLAPFINLVFVWIFNNNGKKKKPFDVSNKSILIYRYIDNKFFFLSLHFFFTNLNVDLKRHSIFDHGFHFHFFLMKWRRQPIFGFE